MELRVKGDEQCSHLNFSFELIGRDHFGSIENGRLTRRCKIIPVYYQLQWLPNTLSQTALWTLEGQALGDVVLDQDPADISLQDLFCVLLLDSPFHACGLVLKKVESELSPSNPMHTVVLDWC